VIADKAYSHPSTRQAMRARRIRFACPERDDQLARPTAKGFRSGRPPVFDPQLYCQRNVVALFQRLEQFRGLAIRYAKRAAYCQAEHTIAAIILWLR
jgi:transposase